ncbi:MAG: hypothetical protein EHM90_03195, partial [Chloroflexi bacterium]
MSDELVEERRVIPGPREGWMSVVLLGVMLLSLCWAVQSAGWLDRMEYLVPVALWALVAGLAFGTSRLSVAAPTLKSALLGERIAMWSRGEA